MQMNNALELALAIIAVLFCIGATVVGFLKNLANDKDKDGDE